MDWLKDLVTPVLQTGTWGLVVYCLGRKVITKFEAAIGRTMDRLVKAGPAEFAPPSPPSQSGSTLRFDEASKAPAIAAAAPAGLPARIEERINIELAAVSAPERQAYLVRMLAGTRIAWAFEALNTVVLGSQIRLLENLNTGPLAVTDAHGFYQQASSDSPEYYRTYPFEGWLNWLVTFARFVIREGDSLSISEEGREFLRYLISRGYTFARFG
jgi:hypothetical protein